MSIKIQIIVAVLVVLALLFIANMVRKETLDIRFALSWLTVGTAVLILDLFPGMMNRLVHLLGIELPADHNYDTMSAFIVDLLGRIPHEDETPSVVYNDVEFTVLLTEDNWVSRIKAACINSVDENTAD